MRFWNVISALVLGLSLSVRANVAAEWIPELESAEISQENGVDNGWSPEADFTRRRVLLNKVLEQSRSLYAEKKYKESMERAKYANKVEESYLNDEVIAQCLAHIGRPVEALAVLGKLPYSSWSARVEVYETLGMYKQALKACALPDANVEPYVLKCMLLMNHGERAEAIKLAQATYFKFTGNGQEAPQVVKFFTDNGLPLPEPRASSEAQAAIVALIGKLPQIPEPKSQDDLHKQFARKFSIIGRSREGLSYGSDERLEEPICRIYLHAPVQWAGPYETTLSFQVNPGTSTVKRSDIEHVLHDLGMPTESESGGLGSGPPIVEHVMEYSLSDARLRFTFSGTDRHLREFVKAWTVPRTKAVVSQKKQSASPSILDIKREISSYHYKKAARDLMFTSINHLRSPDQRVREEYRELLVKCFQLLKKPEVADYLRIAPCHHIECTINQAQSDPDKLDLTLDTYMHRLWNVHGGAGNAKDYYLIGMPSAGSAHLYQKENPALFAKLFELIGPLAGQQNKKIAPLPAQLMDSIEFPAH